MKRPLFEQLREGAKEEQRDDAAWRDRAAGELSPDDEARLLARARAKEGTEDELLARTTAPLSQEREDALLDLVLGASARASTSAGAVTPPLPAADEREERPSNVVPIARARAPVPAAPKPRRLRLVWAAPAVAAAAALVLWAKVHHDDAAELPAYAVELEGADSETRGEGTTAPPSTAGARRSVSAGARVGVIARPGSRVTAPVAAAAYLVINGRAAPIAVPVRVSEAGFVSIEGSREQLFGTVRGPVDVVVWIGASGSLPTVERAAAAPDSGNAHGAQRLVVPLQLP